MVRLKACEAASQSIQDKHFNSTMVRLKGKLKTISISSNKFQFHYGTIKSSILW